MPNTLEPNQLLGGLYSNGEQRLVFPLKHTEVKAKIALNVSRVEVTQTFTNPLTEPLEAVYVFPLPDEAAVDEMEIKIGDRTIKGNIKKREEAQQIYEQARSEGRTAGLLEQQRDNIFTQSLANIQPGEQIDVTIHYSDSLKFIGIDAGVPISDIRSPSHQLRIERQESIAQIKLGGEDTIPNKDLILRYCVAGNETQATVLTHLDNRGGHFAVYLIPALEYNSDQIVPKDVVFLMDTSGSQQGEPLHQCQALMRQFIDGLNPDDTFTIVDFANTTTKLSSAPLPNTPQNRRRAIDYINQLQANGGTELLNGIHAVLNFPAAPAGRLRSIVLLTDGYIGNENAVLSEVEQGLKPGNRLYSFGVGSSVNRFLLNRLAEIGRGTAQVIRHDEPTDEVVEKFCRQINHPVLTNIQLIWEGTGAPAIYPSTPPDLFAEQPLVLFGRTSALKDDTKEQKLCITGTTAGGNHYEQTLNLTFAATMPFMIFGARDEEEPEPIPQLEIISAIGLDATAIASITQHLQQLNLPTGFNGEIVFEFLVSKSRVGQIVLDQVASTVKAVAAIAPIKRSLTTWICPSTTATVRLTLRIQS